MPDENIKKDSTESTESEKEVQVDLNATIQEITVDITSSRDTTDTDSETEKEMVSLKPPGPLVLKAGEDQSLAWKRFKTRYEFFEVAIQLASKPAEVQVATFMSVIGEDSIPIYESFTLTDAEKKDVAKIKAKFEAYYTPKTNVAYERLVFNNTVQKANQTVNDFLTEILNKVKTCDYGTMQDELVKDKIIQGVSDDKLREKLLND